MPDVPGLSSRLAKLSPRRAAKSQVYQYYSTRDSDFPDGTLTGQVSCPPPHQRHVQVEEAVQLPSLPSVANGGVMTFTHAGFNSSFACRRKSKQATHASWLQALV